MVETPARGRKLLATVLILLMAALGGIAYLTILPQTSLNETQQLWSVAAIGGILGGVCRGLFFLSFDDYAFRHRCLVGQSSKWALKLAGDQLDDRFDPLGCWYSYALKPFLGALLGVLFALGIELGIMSLGFKSDPEADRSWRILFLGALAGLLLEAVFDRLRRLVENKD